MRSLERLRVSRKYFQRSGATMAFFMGRLRPTARVVVVQRTRISPLRV